MKLYIRFSLILVSLSLLTFIGCREDILIEEEPPIVTPVGSDLGEVFPADISGVVRDDTGAIIPDATIIVDGTTVTTDEFGLFSAIDLDAPGTGLYIKVLKEGYFTGGTHYFPQGTTAPGVEITLIRKETTTFDAAVGYTEQLPNGVRISIPADGLQLEGQDYSGQVNIASVWLDPEDDATFNTMPGALIAQDASGEAQMLQTFGMIGVEMTDGTGRPLQLKEGSLAELSFPLGGLESAAPQTIPLWHFDETSGIWVEEGQAEKSNGLYTAQVPHFTWWNCDVPYGLTQLCLDIVDQNGDPIENLTACLSIDAAFNFCNPQNQYCGWVPVGENLDLELRDICNEVIHTEAIGPFVGSFTDVTTQVITVTLPSYASLSFTGQAVDCGGDALTDNGVVSLTIDDQTFYDFNLDNGAYEINLINCSVSAAEGTLRAIDTAELESGETEVILVTGQNDYQTDISACGVLLTELVTIESSMGQLVTEEVSAYQTAAETLLIIKESNNSNTVTYIGFKGFGEGTFSGNILSPIESTGAQQGLVDQATITITRYDDIGGFIVGSFSEGAFSGDFIVTRER